MQSLRLDSMAGGDIDIIYDIDIEAPKFQIEISNVVITGSARVAFGNIRQRIGMSGKTTALPTWLKK